MKKIFIIEDDKKIRDELTILLERYRYKCLSTDDFENIIEVVISAKPHLILLDINLPIYDGYYICKKIRERVNIPIIIVTCRDTEIDELISMNLGADDFISKPYNTQILIARIASLLRRTYDNSNMYTIEYHNLIVNISKSEVQYNGSNISLTKNEMGIMTCLIKNKENIVSRDEIMQELWESDEFVDDNTLTVNINRLRKKLELIGIKDYIRTKRGQGYMLRWD
ncbi:MAG: response regulator transcription factor [Vallitalea sp.]|jgi:DNA-binding response OmpR family regulator|nr:response regulator transcription factor [Vallitalea sp.]